MTLRKDLIEALRDWGVLDPTTDDVDGSLISSGRLDSTALFSLSLWVEERIGRPVDPTSFNLVEEWDTVGRIVAFVEFMKGEAGRLRPSTPHAVASGQSFAQAKVLPRGGAIRPDDIEIVRYSPERKYDILQLQQRLWSSDLALNERFFAWRYEQNPVVGQPLIYLAVRNNAAVAMRASFPSRWEIGPGSSEETWYLSDDLVVLPEFESTGIFAQFVESLGTDLAAMGHDFFLSLSALRVTRLQSLAAGAVGLGSMKPLGHRPGWAAALDRAQQTLARTPFLWRTAATLDRENAAAAVFARLDHADPVVYDGTRVRADSVARPKEMADLVRRLGHDGRFRQKRDESYLDWRYRNPLHEYRFLYANGLGGLDGYLVLERNLSDMGNSRRVNIADWEATSASVANTLLRAVLQLGRPEELVSWSENLPSAQIATLLGHGFESIDVDQVARGLPSVLVWPTGRVGSSYDQPRGGRSLLSLDDWDLRMIYTSLA